MVIEVVASVSSAFDDRQLKQVDRRHRRSLRGVRSGALSGEGTPRRRSSLRPSSTRDPRLRKATPEVVRNACGLGGGADGRGGIAAHPRARLEHIVSGGGGGGGPRRRGRPPEARAHVAAWRGGAGRWHRLRGVAARRRRLTAACVRAYMRATHGGSLTTFVLAMLVRLLGVAVAATDHPRPPYPVEGGGILCLVCMALAAAGGDRFQAAAPSGAFGWALGRAFEGVLRSKRAVEASVFSQVCGGLLGRRQSGGFACGRLDTQPFREVRERERVSFGRGMLPAPVWAVSFAAPRSRIGSCRSAWSVWRAALGGMVRRPEAQLGGIMGTFPTICGRILRDILAPARGCRPVLPLGALVAVLRTTPTGGMSPGIARRSKSRCVGTTLPARTRCSVSWDGPPPRAATGRMRHGWSGFPGCASA